MVKANRVVAESVVSTFILQVQEKSKVHNSGQKDANYVVGYLEGFLSMLAADSPKVFEIIVTRINAIQQDRTNA